MKISKIFAGLVVCGALFFPGAVNSSAKEINASASPEALNYFAKEKTESLTISAFAQDKPYRDYGNFFDEYHGPVFKYTFTIDRDPPYAQAIYSGNLLYNKEKVRDDKYWYEGRTYLQNPL
ncbi:hypothetical protein [Lysinibacillus sp. NPDC092081]|uniref:hypothetical protein n=1 Tax=Lysinibacillus sp. NPDC092081 TaxID=3364131 RepID=UPI00382CFE26